MVNIWLLGGFGNVLFQILAGRVLTKKGNKINFVKNLTQKNSITKAIGWTIHQPLYSDLVPKTQLVKKQLLFAGATVFVGMISKTFKIKFKMATFYDENIKFSKPYAKNIFGYFQNKSFLKEHKDELLALGQDIRKLYGSNTTNVVVHYRKGDSGWAIKNHDYYLKVKEMIQQESSKIMVVTDSPNDARAFFLNHDNIKIISSKNALEDFIILLSANKLYCAPSTFSWWAAHALDKNAQIVMPKMFREFFGIYIDNVNLTFVD